MKTVCFIALLLLWTATGLHSQNQAWERNRSIAKGTNLSNWLEAGWLGDTYPEAGRYQKADLEFLKEIGLKTVRLPVIFEWLSSAESPYELRTDHATFGLIDSVIQWTQELDMNLIIVNHHGRYISNANYFSEIPRLSCMWRNIVEYYAHTDPDHVFFELRNEADSEISNTNLRVLMNAIIDSIRTVTTTHSLIVGANWWNAGWSLIETKPYDDENIIYTFHQYEPYRFTHQGLSWSGQPEGSSFPTRVNRIADLQQTILDVQSWSEHHMVPVFLGEFGVGVHADAVSSCLWINAVASALRATDMPWIYWDVLRTADSFGFLNNDAMDPDSIRPCFKFALELDTNMNLAEGDLNEVKIYPNPFANDIFIESELGQEPLLYELYDLQGQVLVRNLTFETIQLHLPNLRSGTYLLRLHHKGRSSIEKLSKIGP